MIQLGCALSLLHEPLQTLCVSTWQDNDYWGCVSLPFQIPKGSIFVYKGLDSFVESYSTFYDNLKQHETKLKVELFKREVMDVYVCGLATDVCVGRLAELRKNFPKLFHYLCQISFLILNCKMLHNSNVLYSTFFKPVSSLSCRSSTSLRLDEA